MSRDSKYFTIQKEDVGTEAYLDIYVHELIVEVERLHGLIADWATKSAHPVCRCEQCTALSNEIIAKMMKHTENA